jgi:transketolase/transaldolase
LEYKYTISIARSAILGQQIWLDNLSRHLLASGQLAGLIAQDGVQGLTSNPAIFYQAIQNDPPQGRPALLRTAHATPEARRRPGDSGCNALRPVRAHLRKSHGRAGFVSFEVAPRLAHDAEGTVADAKRLWALIGRPKP